MQSPSPLDPDAALSPRARAMLADARRRAREDDERREDAAAAATIGSPARTAAAAAANRPAAAAVVPSMYANGGWRALLQATTGAAPQPTAAATSYESQSARVSYSSSSYSGLPQSNSMVAAASASFSTPADSSSSSSVRLCPIASASSHFDARALSAPCSNSQLPGSERECVHASDVCLDPRRALLVSSLHFLNLQPRGRDFYKRLSINGQAYTAHVLYFGAAAAPTRSGAHVPAANLLYFESAEDCQKCLRNHPATALSLLEPASQPLLSPASPAFSSLSRSAGSSAFGGRPRVPLSWSGIDRKFVVSPSIQGGSEAELVKAIQSSWTASGETSPSAFVPVTQQHVQQQQQAQLSSPLRSHRSAFLPAQEPPKWAESSQQIAAAYAGTERQRRMSPERVEQKYSDQQFEQARSPAREAWSTATAAPSYSSPDRMAAASARDYRSPSPPPGARPLTLSFLSADRSPPPAAAAHAASAAPAYTPGAPSLFAPLSTTLTGPSISLQAPASSFYGAQSAFGGATSQQQQQQARPTTTMLEWYEQQQAERAAVTAHAAVPFQAAASVPAASAPVPDYRQAVASYLERTKSSSTTSLTLAQQSSAVAVPFCVLQPLLHHFDGPVPAPPVDPRVCPNSRASLLSGGGATSDSDSPHPGGGGGAIICPHQVAWVALSRVLLVPSTSLSIAPCPRTLLPASVAEGSSAAGADFWKFASIVTADYGGGGTEGETNAEDSERYDPRALCGFVARPVFFSGAAARAVEQAGGEESPTRHAPLPPAASVCMLVFPDAQSRDQCLALHPKRVYAVQTDADLAPLSPTPGAAPLGYASVQHRSTVSLSSPRYVDVLYSRRDAQFILPPRLWHLLSSRLEGAYSSRDSPSMAALLSPASTGHHVSHILFGLMQLLRRESSATMPAFAPTILPTSASERVARGLGPHAPVAVSTTNRLEEASSVHEALARLSLRNTEHQRMIRSSIQPPEQPWLLAAASMRSERPVVGSPGASSSSTSMMSPYLRAQSRSFLSPSSTSASLSFNGEGDPQSARDHAMHVHSLAYPPLVDDEPPAAEAGSTDADPKELPLDLLLQQLALPPLPAPMDADTAQRFQDLLLAAFSHDAQALVSSTLHKGWWWAGSRRALESWMGRAAAAYASRRRAPVEFSVVRLDAQGSLAITFLRRARVQHARLVYDMEHGGSERGAGKGRFRIMARALLSEPLLRASRRARLRAQSWSIRARGGLNAEDDDDESDYISLSDVTYPSIESIFPTSTGSSGGQDAEYDDDGSGASTAGLCRDFNFPPLLGTIRKRTRNAVARIAAGRAAQSYDADLARSASSYQHLASASPSAREFPGSSPSEPAFPALDSSSFPSFELTMPATLESAYAQMTERKEDRMQPLSGAQQQQQQQQQQTKALVALREQQMLQQQVAVQQQLQQQQQYEAAQQQHHQRQQEQLLVREPAYNASPLAADADTRHDQLARAPSEPEPTKVLQRDTSGSPHVAYKNVSMQAARAAEESERVQKSKDLAAAATLEQERRQAVIAAATTAAAASVRREEEKTQDAQFEQMQRAEEMQRRAGAALAAARSAASAAAATTVPVAASKPLAPQATPLSDRASKRLEFNDLISASPLELPLSPREPATRIPSPSTSPGRLQQARHARAGSAPISPAEAEAEGSRIPQLRSHMFAQSARGPSTEAASPSSRDRSASASPVPATLPRRAVAAGVSPSRIPHVRSASVSSSASSPRSASGKTAASPRRDVAAARSPSKIPSPSPSAASWDSSTATVKPKRMTTTTTTITTSSSSRTHFSKRVPASSTTKSPTSKRSSSGSSTNAAASPARSTTPLRGIIVRDAGGSAGRSPRNAAGAGGAGASSRRITFADQAEEAIVNAAAARALIAPHLASDISVDPSLASLTALSTELCQMVLQSLPFESRARMARATSLDPAGPDSDQSVHDQIVAIVAEALERKLKVQDEMAARALRDAQQEASSSFATPARPTAAHTDAASSAPLTPGLLAAATARLSPAQVASVSSCLGGSVALAFEHLIGRTYFACTRNRERVEAWLKKQRTDCTIVRLGTQPGTLSLSFVISLTVQHIRLRFDPVTEYFSLQGSHSSVDPRTGRTVEHDLSMHSFASIPDLIANGQHVYAFPPLWTPALTKHSQTARDQATAEEIKNLKPIVRKSNK